MTTPPVFVIRLTLAQFRMLGRAVHGEYLPTNRFQDIGTIAALNRKGCIADDEGAWHVTEFGMKVYAAKGFIDFRPEADAA